MPLGRTITARLICQLLVGVVRQVLGVTRQSYKGLAPPRKAESQQDKEQLQATQTTVDRHHSLWQAVGVVRAADVV